MENRDPITEKIIGCCYKVHRELGPGFGERIYHNALLIALNEKSLEFETEKVYNVLFNGKKVSNLRLDLIVRGSVIVEIKALSGNIPEVVKYQILSYLKASCLKIGLLINFGNKSCQVKRFSL